MEELINYLNKTFDEPTLKVINFIEKAKLLVSDMRIDAVKEGDKIVNKVSPNIIETSYLKLCDEDTEFNHNIMGEIFLHYLDYILRDARANWRFDINKLKKDLASKCTYCNIKLKCCPMKVLAYVKKCAKDENINEMALFANLMKIQNKPEKNDIEEENVADKIFSLCANPTDIKGAEFLLDTESIKIEKEENNKIYYKVLDFEIKNISFINNLYSFFVQNEGEVKEFDLSNLKINENFSYMFNKSPIELAVYAKVLCDNAKIDYHNVFEKIYKKIGRFENVARIAYYNEYMKKIDTTLEDKLPLQNELKDVLTYIRNYDKNTKLPYIKFDFLIYTKNTEILNNTVSILNKYCRTYNYLSNKSVVYVDTEMFIKRTKDVYDVINQLDRLYNENDFIVFTNVDKAININEARLDAFLSTIPKFYNRNARTITVFCGEKNETEKMLEKYDDLKRNVFKHIIDVESNDVEIIKENVFKRLKKIGHVSSSSKSQIENYIEKQYKKGMVNETEFISEICNNIIYNKFKNNEEDDDIKSVNIPEPKQDINLEKTLEKLDNLVGLHEVKFRVKEIIKYLEYQKKIGEIQNINLNMIFKGNAGTRKNYNV